jgi:hypothetical protein
MTEREAASLLLKAAQRGDIKASALGIWAASFGLPTIKSGEPAETLLCSACDDEHPLLFLDNEIADCGDCGRRLQYRPEMPIDALTRFRCLFCEVRRLGLDR